MNYPTCEFLDYIRWGDNEDEMAPLLYAPRHSDGSSRPPKYHKIKVKKKSEPCGTFYFTERKLPEGTFYPI